MRRYLIAYALWLAGVVSAAAIAYAYYRRVLALGYTELEVELGRRGAGPNVPPEDEPPAAAPASPSAARQSRNET